ncbi:MAG: hypothetical protein WA957_12015 [Alteraurantiacibacter sp.]
MNNTKQSHDHAYRSSTAHDGAAIDRLPREYEADAAFTAPALL